MSQMSTDQLAAASAAQAARLRRAATTIRREAGGLTYHPATGRRPEVSPALLAALDEVERAVREVQRGAPERAAGGPTGEGAAQAGGLRAADAAVDAAAGVVVAAADVLRGVLPGERDASVDAPYGAGAPRRPHPGALATLLAERVEELARALEVAAIVRANLARR
jgi:hypothetical protein